MPRKLKVHMSNWVVNIDDMTCYSKISKRKFKIKYKNDIIYSLYECPYGKYDQWHKCVPEILDEYMRAIEDILLGD